MKANGKMANKMGKEPSSLIPVKNMQESGKMASNTGWEYYTIPMELFSNVDNGSKENLVHRNKKLLNIVENSVTEEATKPVTKRTSQKQK